MRLYHSIIHALRIIDLSDPSCSFSVVFLSSFWSFCLYFHYCFFHVMYPLHVPLYIPWFFPNQRLAVLLPRDLTFRFRLSVFAQMRLADIATAWLRDDTHETLVSTMPYWEHCPWLAGCYWVFFLGGGDDKDGWISMGELGETLKMHNLKRKGSEVGDAPNVYLHSSQLPFKKVVPFFPPFYWL